MRRQLALLALAPVAMFSGSPASADNTGLSVSLVHVGPVVVGECTLTGSGGLVVSVEVRCAASPGLTTSSGASGQDTATARIETVGLSPGTLCASGIVHHVTPFGVVDSPRGPLCIAM